MFVTYANQVVVVLSLTSHSHYGLARVKSTAGSKKLQLIHQHDTTRRGGLAQAGIQCEHILG